MNITLRQLRAFIAVAELGQFNIAARNLHLTQSAVSILIRDLEREIGVRLFDRHTRMVSSPWSARNSCPRRARS